MGFFGFLVRLDNWVKNQFGIDYVSCLCASVFLSFSLHFLLFFSLRSLFRYANDSGSSEYTVAFLFFCLSLSSLWTLTPVVDLLRVAAWRYHANLLVTFIFCFNRFFFQFCSGLLRVHWVVFGCFFGIYFVTYFVIFDSVIGLVNW